MRIPRSCLPPRPVPRYGAKVTPNRSGMPIRPRSGRLQRERLRFARLCRACPESSTLIPMEHREGSPVTGKIVGRALINYRYHELARSVSAVPVLVSRFNNHRRMVRRVMTEVTGGSVVGPPPLHRPPVAAIGIDRMPTSRARRDANARTSGVRAGPLLAGR